MGVKCISMEYDQPHGENISQYVQSDSFIRNLYK